MVIIIIKIVIILIIMITSTKMRSTIIERNENNAKVNTKTNAVDSNHYSLENARSMPLNKYFCLRVQLC